MLATLAVRQGVVYRSRGEIERRAVGLLDKLRGRGESVHLEGTRTLNLAGPQHYEQNLRKLVKRNPERDARVHFPATLVLEKRNKHDRNAVAVEWDGRTVGYLSKADAAAYRPSLDRLAATGVTITVDGIVYAGHHGGNYWSVGVRMPQAKKMPSA